MQTEPNRTFIESNTKQVDLLHLKQDCVVPVFSKDNEITISHPNFIETVYDAANSFFKGETIQEPQMRVSHIIKGRTPGAIHKSVAQLTDSDKTIYYERMMFCFEVPTMSQDVAGNRLNLTIGGVRAYNHENLYSRKGRERFKIFIGFQNLVCCNMCISTDGYMSQVQVTSCDELFKAAMSLFEHYNPTGHLNSINELQNVFMTEHQFAQFLGKSRLYQSLPVAQKRLLPEMLMTDTQTNLVAKAYYNDENFGIGSADEISLWRVYNLLTGANKSSYIDNFIDRSHNAYQLAMGIGQALKGGGNYSWFIE